ncbi:MAG: periplasmic heavy metal sensor [Verrucomicrobia bacterium]|nr:periplasmic heavy metal sensor [Verrucomicrobiota bacterium]
MKNTMRILIGAGLIAAQAMAADAPTFPVTEQFVTDKLGAVTELSEAQRDKASALIRGQLPALKKALTRFAEAQTAVKELMADTDVSEQAIRSECAKLTDVLVDLAKQRAKMAQNLKSVLTPDQPEGARHLGKFVDDIVKALGKE